MTFTNGNMDNNNFRFRAMPFTVAHNVIFLIRYQKQTCPVFIYSFQFRVRTRNSTKALKNREGVKLKLNIICYQLPSTSPEYGFTKTCKQIISCTTAMQMSKSPQTCFFLSHTALLVMNVFEKKIAFGRSGLGDRPLLLQIYVARNKARLGR